ncbi:MAG: ABC transporter permease subunit [Lachnospiraceae bacterium]|nr:ABC transporter permease subunit [Lachnospiraceae bacterium]
MLCIPLAFFILFKYVPMVGTIVAFKKYNIFKGIWASEWVGFKNFEEAFKAKEFATAIKNTLILNIGGLLINFPFPIVTAILLSEMRYKKVKKFTETILYIPHFLSMVVIAGIMYQVFGPRGMVNSAITAMGFQAVPFMTNTTSWRIIYWGSGIWSGLGYGMIIYLAAIAGVNTELYDAAYIDGAGRWKRIWHVTLPQIKPTIVTMTIMNVGKILSISFERPLLLGNVTVKGAAQVISTYVYSVGLQAGRYDFAAAVGLFQSVVCVCMVLIANKIAKKLGEEGIM